MDLTPVEESFKMRIQKNRNESRKIGHKRLKLKRTHLKLFFGLLLGAVFMYFAFRKVNFSQMGDAFKQANYWYLLLAVFFIFFSHWMRAVRWHYLMAPIQKIKIKHLLSALIIGYMANTFTPAHLGEFLRAYVLSKKSQVRTSSIFGTIVIERIIDVITLLFLMALTFVVFPFPDWVSTSGYLMFVGVLILLILLIVMKKHSDAFLRILNKILRPLPEKISLKISSKVGGLLHSFLDGVVGLKNWRHYVITAVLSLLIWGCYGAILQVHLYAFDFVSQYDLPWTATLVVLVITTISVIVPSSPGYVGTYHWLCQLSLGLFAVPKSEALTLAFVLHGINFIPVLIVGLILAGVEGVSLSKPPQTSLAEEDGTLSEKSPGNGSSH